MNSKTCLTIILLIINTGLSGQQIKVENFTNEELNFSGYYNWGLLWVEAGKVNLKSSDTIINGLRKHKYKAIGNSLKAFDWFYKLRDTLESICDYKNCKTANFERIVHEKSRHEQFSYKFCYEKNYISYNHYIKNKKTIKDTIKLDSNTFDILNIAYHVRGIDFDSLNKNDKIPIKLLIDKKIHRLHVRYLGIEKIKPKGKKEYNCYKIRPLLIKGNLFGGGEDMTIYVSKDEKRLPVMVEAKVLIGSVKAILNEKNTKKEEAAKN
ncbi:MAG: DUF3108 domain-containing protein [Marinifilaceae bacterium]|jgi:hypothetical protein|nr:DUF3108 domain-containing protein [Marinifilaceae bacterium]